MSKSIEDTATVLKSAASAVEAAGIPDDLRVAAFKVAAGLLSADAGGPVRAALPTSDNSQTSSAGSLSLIAQRLKLDEAVVGEIFDVSPDGELALVIGASKLEKAKAAATKQIALLVAAGRQAAGLDQDWTPMSVIRPIVTDFGRYDGPNFATAIREMDDHCAFRGKGQQREIKVNRQGFEAAAEIIKRLAGDVR